MCWEGWVVPNPSLSWSDFRYPNRSVNFAPFRSHQRLLNTQGQLATALIPPHAEGHFSLRSATRHISGGALWHCGSLIHMDPILYHPCMVLYLNIHAFNGFDGKCVNVDKYTIRGFYGYVYPMCILDWWCAETIRRGCSSSLPLPG